MNTIATHILLAAIMSVQLLGTQSLEQGQCASAACACSAEIVSAGSCCCSAEPNPSTCDAPAGRASTCCSDVRVSKDTASQHICHCGDKDKSPPASAPIDSRSELLAQIAVQANTISTDVPATGHESHLGTPVGNHLFFGGLSAQPLFCLWLI